MTVTTGGLYLTTGGFSVAGSGMKVTGGLTVNSGGAVVTGGMTVFNGVMISGGLTVTNGGLYVTSGFTLASGGLFVTGGLTVNNAGIVASNGLSILSGGMTAVGGLTITSAGLSIVGGLSVTSGGIYVTNGLTVGSGGITITGGVTVSNGGVVISAGGVTVNSGGVYIDSGGMTVQSGGLKITGGITVQNAGILVAGGLTVYGNTALQVPAVVFSDERLKSNIQTLENSLDKVSKLRGVYYTWRKENAAGLKFDDKRHLGLIAQEVQSVVPEVVHEMENGSYLGVSYPDLVPLLIEAVRELDKRSVLDSTKANCKKIFEFGENLVIRLSKLEESQKLLKLKLSKLLPTESIDE